MERESKQLTVELWCAGVSYVINIRSVVTSLSFFSLHRINLRLQVFEMMKRRVENSSRPERNVKGWRMSSKEIYLIWLWLSMFMRPALFKWIIFLESQSSSWSRSLFFEWKCSFDPFDYTQAGPRLHEKTGLTFVESPRKLSQSGRYYVRPFYDFSPSRNASERATKCFL